MVKLLQALAVLSTGMGIGCGIQFWRLEKRRIQLGIRPNHALWPWQYSTRAVAESRGGPISTALKATRSYLGFLEVKLLDLGYRPNQARERSAVLLAVQLALLMGGILSGQGLEAVLGTGVILLLLTAVSKQVAKANQKASDVQVYRIYRFMKLQGAAGMSVTETLTKLHEISREAKLQNGLKAYSLTYFRTMDFEKSEQALFGFYRGQSAMLLCATLQHGLKTGDYSDLVKRQETAMMHQFYEWIETKGQWLRFKGILLAVSICVMIFCLLLAPMVYEIQMAIQTIFSM